MMKDNEASNYIFMEIKSCYKLSMGGGAAMDLI